MNFESDSDDDPIGVENIPPNQFHRASLNQGLITPKPITRLFKTSSTPKAPNSTIIPQYDPKLPYSSDFHQSMNPYQLHPKNIQTDPISTQSQSHNLSYPHLPSTTPNLSPNNNNPQLLYNQNTDLLPPVIDTTSSSAPFSTNHPQQSFHLPPVHSTNYQAKSAYSLPHTSIYNDYQSQYNHPPLNPHNNNNSAMTTTTSIIGLESYVPLQAPDVVNIDLLRPYTSPFNSTNLYPTEEIKIIQMGEQTRPYTILSQYSKSKFPQLHNLHIYSDTSTQTQQSQSNMNLNENQFDIDNPIDLTPTPPSKLSFASLPQFIPQPIIITTSSQQQLTSTLTPTQYISRSVSYQQLWSPHSGCSVPDDIDTFDEWGVSLPLLEIETRKLFEFHLDQIITQFEQYESLAQYGHQLSQPLSHPSNSNPQSTANFQHSTLITPVHSQDLHPNTITPGFQRSIAGTPFQQYLSNQSLPQHQSTTRQSNYKQFITPLPSSTSDLSLSSSSNSYHQPPPLPPNSTTSTQQFQQSNLSYSYFTPQSNTKSISVSLLELTLDISPYSLFQSQSSNSNTHQQSPPQPSLFALWFVHNHPYYCTRLMSLILIDFLSTTPTLSNDNIADENEDMSIHSSTPQTEITIAQRLQKFPQCLKMVQQKQILLHISFPFICTEHLFSFYPQLHKIISPLALYQPPDQFQINHNIQHQTDLYSAASKPFSTLTTNSNTIYQQHSQYFPQFSSSIAAKSTANPSVPGLFDALLNCIKPSSLFLTPFTQYSSTRSSLSTFSNNDSRRVFGSNGISIQSKPPHQSGLYFPTQQPIHLGRNNIIAGTILSLTPWIFFTSNLNFYNQSTNNNNSSGGENEDHQIHYALQFITLLVSPPPIIPSSLDPHPLVASTSIASQFLNPTPLTSFHPQHLNGTMAATTITSIRILVSGNDKSLLTQIKQQELQIGSFVSIFGYINFVSTFLSIARTMIVTASSTTSSNPIGSGPKQTQSLYKRKPKTAQLITSQSIGTHLEYDIFCGPPTPTSLLNSLTLDQIQTLLNFHSLVPSNHLNSTSTFKTNDSFAPILGKHQEFRTSLLCDVINIQPIQTTLISQAVQLAQYFQRLLPQSFNLNQSILTYYKNQLTSTSSQHSTRLNSNSQTSDLSSITYFIQTLFHRLCNIRAPISQFKPSFNFILQVFRDQLSLTEIEFNSLPPTNQALPRFDYSFASNQSITNFLSNTQLDQSIIYAFFKLLYEFGGVNGYLKAKMFILVSLVSHSSSTPLFTSQNETATQLSYSSSTFNQQSELASIVSNYHHLPELHPISLLLFNSSRDPHVNTLYCYSQMFNGCNPLTHFETETSTQISNTNKNAIESLKTSYLQQQTLTSTRSHSDSNNNMNELMSNNSLIDLIRYIMNHQSLSINLQLQQYPFDKHDLSLLQFLKLYSISAPKLYSSHQLHDNISNPSQLNHHQQQLICYISEPSPHKPKSSAIMKQEHVIAQNAPNTNSASTLFDLTYVLTNPPHIQYYHDLGVIEHVLEPNDPLPVYFPIYESSPDQRVLSIPVFTNTLALPLMLPISFPCNPNDLNPLFSIPYSSLHNSYQLRIHLARSFQPHIGQQALSLITLYSLSISQYYNQQALNNSQRQYQQPISALALRTILLGITSAITKLLLLSNSTIECALIAIMIYNESLASQLFLESPPQIIPSTTRNSTNYNNDSMLASQSNPILDEFSFYPQTPLNFIQLPNDLLNIERLGDSNASNQNTSNPFESYCNQFNCFFIRVKEFIQDHHQQPKASSLDNQSIRHTMSTPYSYNQFR